MRSGRKSLRLPEPLLQVEFSVCLASARKAYLIDALSDTVARLDIPALDRQIAEIVPHEFISRLASAGLRAELLFPLPLVLAENPRLLTYYRLLLGFSQKAFYGQGTGTGAFRQMEDGGTLPKDPNLRALSEAMTERVCTLVEGIGIGRITRDLIDDLTLLTLGPQLRGGANVKKGSTSIHSVFELIHAIVRRSLVKATEKKLEVRNAAGRKVLIEFSSDPDIVIREVMARNSFRNIVAIEVKGGTDYSNIHNRIGEAEKSHQKARKNGYTECWTIVNVARLDHAKAAQESPSTDRFYQLAEIIIDGTDAFIDFRNHIAALTGIRS
ncbi:MAG: XcyI family restriction endonuclease [Phycisphaerales bacterium]